MGQPASRLFDMHVCPLVTVLVPHVGGPIVMASMNVITGGQPQARAGDMCVCVGPPDVIALGSTTVYVNGQMAARIGDLTAHGGTLVGMWPTVIIGG
ncbi:PAAR domain-containing protein [Labrys neptuniae]